MIAKFYYHLKQKRSFTGYPLLKFFLCIICSSATLPALAVDVAPVFTNGSPQSLSVCANSAAVSIDYLLTINAIAPGNTETWSVSGAPLHGTLSGFNTSDTTDGSALTPSGLAYMPAAGFTGIDSFTIQVSDGTDTATTTIYVSVHALPTLTSTTTPPAICNGTTFNYTPTSSAAGATYMWALTVTGGISAPATSGAGSISEVLSNSTYYDVTATFIYTISAGGCHNTADVSVIVKPTPRLTGSLSSDTVCSGAVINYTVSSLTAGTTISWSRDSVAGITPATASGTGDITDSLSNSSAMAQNVTYLFYLSANGCTSSRSATVTVEPPVAGPAITTAPPTSLCTNTLYQNFGTSTPAPAGVSYSWSADNAVIFTRGAGNQYILANFNNPGYAYVTLTANVPGSACNSTTTYTVNVGAASSVSSPVIYAGGQFIYLDNTASSYQWGYDNVYTLDSSAISGAIFQSYPDSMPDFTDNYYWVITNEGGCMEKTYYNGPLAVRNVPAGNGESLKVYPNPAVNTVNVEVNGMPGDAAVSLTDMTGRTVRTSTGNKHTMQFNVSDIPAGVYFFTCYKNGLKVATARFIKN